jgi:hypothetical protein
MLPSNWQTGVTSFSAKAHLIESLYKLNFDEASCSFNQRTHTPYWTHTTGIGRDVVPGLSEVHTELVDKHLKASKEKKLLAQAMAIIFWSYLRGF